MQKEKIAVISVSGGMDSTCLLVKLLAEGYRVFAVSFDYGQKHKLEIERLKANLKYFGENGLAGSWKLLPMSFLGDMFQSALTTEGIDIPEGHYAEENMKATVVPNRNAIFSSIIYGYALSLSQQFNHPVEICLGVHSGDHAVYPDCRPEFYESIEKSFALGNWGSENVSYNLPYLNADKTIILQEALLNCEKLGIDFDIVLANTNTSYNPNEKGESSGTSGADIERIEAFLNIGRKDPVPYEGGWEKARENAIKILGEKRI